MSPSSTCQSAFVIDVTQRVSGVAGSSANIDCRTQSSKSAKSEKNSGLLDSGAKGYNLKTTTPYGYVLPGALPPTLKQGTPCPRAVLPARLSCAFSSRTRTPLPIHQEVEEVPLGSRSLKLYTRSSTPRPTGLYLTTACLTAAELHFFGIKMRIKFEDPFPQKQLCLSTSSAGILRCHVKSMICSRASSSSTKLRVSSCALGRQ
jgi:hypothetical protein